MRLDALSHCVGVGRRKDDVVGIGPVVVHVRETMHGVCGSGSPDRVRGTRDRRARRVDRVPSVQIAAAQHPVQ